MSAPASSQRRSIEDLREEVRQEVISLAKLTQEIVDMVYSFSELGFQETWTSDYLVGVLCQGGVSDYGNGFAHATRDERPVA